ncbi:hypothetical protein LTR08_003449 [Meristemomyces frigidus]|nr:hypothetical protein LTR08_003449 [Meristemomyces frigidus]
MSWSLRIGVSSSTRDLVFRQGRGGDPLSLAQVGAFMVHPLEPPADGTWSRALSSPGGPAAWRCARKAKTGVTGAYLITMAPEAEARQLARPADKSSRRRPLRCASRISDGEAPSRRASDADGGRSSTWPRSRRCG